MLVRGMMGVCGVRLGDVDLGACDVVISLLTEALGIVSIEGVAGCPSEDGGGCEMLCKAAAACIAGGGEWGWLGVCRQCTWGVGLGGSLHETSATFPILMIEGRG